MTTYTLSDGSTVAPERGDIVELVDDGWHDRQTHDERETWQGDALPDNVTADGGTTYTVRQED